MLLSGAEVPVIEPLVLSRAEATLACRLGLRVDWSVSVTDPRGEPPPALRSSSRCLHLPFADVEDEEGLDCNTARCREQAIELISFARDVQGAGIVHCDAGVSRSSAVALAMLAAWAPPDLAWEGLRRAVERSEAGGWRTPGRRARPNARMVGVADDVLGLGGRLVSLG